MSKPVLIILFWTSAVSSFTFCSWRSTNINTNPNAQLSFQCTDPSTPVVIIENATIGYAYNANNCTTFIGCSQQVPDFAQYCTGYNTSCSLNQQTFYLQYASQTCNNPYLNYVYVNYSCIAANVQPPSVILSSQQVVYSTGLTYLSTSSFFPLSDTFPYAPFQCSCSFKPQYQGVTANISIRALIVQLWNYTSCSQKLTIRSPPNNDTVFCSRSVSSNVTTYIQLESNPSITFQTISTDGHFLLEIRTLTSSILGTIGSLTCSHNNETQPCDSSTNNPLTSESHGKTLGQPTNKLTISTGDNSGTHQTSPKPANATSSEANSTLSTTGTMSVSKSLSSAADKKTNDISSGAIAGIVIGCAVLVILLIVLIVVMKYRHNSSKDANDGDISVNNEAQTSKALYSRNQRKDRETWRIRKKPGLPMSNIEHTRNGESELPPGNEAVVEKASAAHNKKIYTEDWVPCKLNQDSRNVDKAGVGTRTLKSRNESTENPNSNNHQNHEGHSETWMTSSETLNVSRNLDGVGDVAVKVDQRTGNGRDGRIVTCRSPTIYVKTGTELAS